jgi:hypothetical protein
MSSARTRITRKMEREMMAKTQDQPSHSELRAVVRVSWRLEELISVRLPFTSAPRAITMTPPTEVTEPPTTAVLVRTTEPPTATTLFSTVPMTVT